MLKIFRNIRSRLLAENKFSKYFLYAIGEITLVVIGIMIALQINNANEIRKDHQLEQVYLKALHEELLQDTATMQQTLIKFQRMEEGVRFVLSVMDDPNKTIKDTLQLLNSFKIMIAHDQVLPTPTVWEELQSSGNLSLIRDRVLIQQLYNYYVRMKSCQRDYENNLEPFIKEGRRYDSNTFSVVDQDDFFENFSVDRIVEEHTLQVLLNDENIYKNTKGLLTGLSISKNVLRRLMKSVETPLASIRENIVLTNK